jgi:sugar O-acyltransferase (sialic acid O-acetyltransferase NeuD family)
MNRIFALFGASGCGRGIMPLLRESVADPDSARFIFVDDKLAGQMVNGYDVLSFDDFAALQQMEKRMAISIADPKIRARLAAQCEAAQLEFFSVKAASAIIMDEVTVGEGALISPFVTFTSNITIGNHFHANIQSYVEHDCVIGDFVTFAPGVKCNGNVHIGDGAYIGSGAVIKQGTPDKPLRIGKGAVVGMGAVVTKDVPEGITVIGNPARPMNS